MCEIVVGMFGVIESVQPTDCTTRASGDWREWTLNCVEVQLTEVRPAIAIAECEGLRIEYDAKQHRLRSFAVDGVERMNLRSFALRWHVGELMTVVCEELLLPCAKN